MKIVSILFLILIFLMLQFQLWLSKEGFFYAEAMKNKIQLQKLDNEKLKKQNDRLQFEIKELKQGEQGVETHARNDLGMIKKEEVFYQVVKNNASEK